MPGRPMRKVFCQGFTRAGLRKGLKIPCRMKGYVFSDGMSYRCKFHGYQNFDGFNKANYTDDTRIKQLSKLIQFKNYTDDKLKEYYYEKIKPRIDNNQPSRYNLRETSKWKNPYRNSGGQKEYPFSLMKFYAYLKKNPELEIKITEARKYGVQTLIDKLLQVFKYQEIEDPNAILWIREKTKFITFLANKLTDFYSDNKAIKC